MRAEDRSKAYTEAGVNINAGNALVERIKKLAAPTMTGAVLSGIGGFGGLFKPDLTGMREPVMVSSTDGVGTKLKLAFASGLHSTIGIDLVAMSANDILVQGALPLFFLDYFATGRLEVDTAAQVIGGVAAGCQEANCVLLGGETAEMPDMYAPGEYDLAGFCVGLADRHKLVDGSAIRPGDVLLGLASSGLHSNGYSLARKILDKSGLKLTDRLPGLDTVVQEALLAPTVIYVRAISALLERFSMKGMVHVTGGGFYDNIPRILPPNLRAEVDFAAWPKSPLFAWLKESGGLNWQEMLQIFNCGIGYILVVDEKDSGPVLSALRELKQEAWTIGRIGARPAGAEAVDIKF